MDLKFCPKCGQQSLTWDGEKKWSCEECGYTLFHNVAGAVAVLIKMEGEILFTRRNQEPKKGKLDLPGGFIDPKESAEKACQREIREELNITIAEENFKYLKSLPNIYEYKNINYNTIDLFYETELAEESNFKLAVDEISEVVWIKAEELNIEDLAFESQKKFFGQWLKL